MTMTLSNVPAMIRLKSLPRHDTSKQTHSMVTGQLQTTVSLGLNVIASPLPNFTWFHYQEMTPVPVVVGTGGNVVLTEGLQSVLRVYIKREEDYGIYRVVVWNRVGSTSLFLGLIKDVNSPPEASCNIVPVAARMGAVIVILILILIVVVIRYRRSLCKGSGLRERNVDYADGETAVSLQRDAVKEESSKHGRAVDGSLPSETDTDPIYEIEADKLTYTELKELETTNGSFTQGTATYEGIQPRAPQVYEDMRK